MPAETKTIEKKQRLLSLLREMFQLDQPDLDFGLYRIMHAKRGQLEAWYEFEARETKQTLRTWAAEQGLEVP